MDSDQLNNLLKGIQEKLGKESSALISDDLGVLLTENTKTLDTIKNKDTEISNLKSTNDKLIASNGSLLQQIGMGVDTRKQLRTFKDEDEEAKTNHVSIRDCFDEKGNFKR